MAKKKLNKDAYLEEMKGLAEHVVNHLGGDRFWRDRSDYQRWSFDGKNGREQWDVVRDLPPLIAAAREYGPPDTRPAKSVWRMVEPELMERIFGEELDKVAEQFKQMLSEDLERFFPTDKRRYEEIEARSSAYRHLTEFVAALKEAGVTEYKTDLTDHGMTAKEIKQLEKYIAEKTTEIADKRNPALGESLFEAPKKGKYPTFGDIEYGQYVDDLRARFGQSLEQLTGFSGMPLGESQVEELMEKLADFDYVEISATLGAQKRQPPEDDYGSRTKFYEALATLAERLSANIVENTLGEVENAIQANRSLLESSEPSTRAMGFNAIRHLKKALSWVSEKFPAMDAPALTEARMKIAQVYDPRWALMAGGPVHEKRMKQIVFTTSPSMPASEADIPETINPARQAVYGHVFMEQPLSNLGTMYFVDIQGQWLQASKAGLTNTESAWQVLQLFPDSGVGRDPELIKAFAAGLEAAAGEGELTIEFKPDMTARASGVLKLKMSQADIKKIPARMQELIAAAQSNLTAEAVLPEIFAKAQKWPYKDKTLAMDKVKAAIEAAWEYNWKHAIDVKSIRVGAFQPGVEWLQEMDVLRRPVARLTSSYLGIIYERDGKTHCVDNCIQLRQFHMASQGYGEDLNVLFWGASPFELPPAQIKRIAK